MSTAFNIQPELEINERIGPTDQIQSNQASLNNSFITIIIMYVEA